MPQQSDERRSVPRSAAEVTPAWLMGVLHSAGVIESSVRVHSLHAERIGLGRGYVAQLLRLHVAYDAPSAGPTTIVAKLPALPALPNSWWAGYIAEWRFYRELAASVPLRTPRYLGGVGDEAAGLAAILLEDLGERAPDGAARAAAPLAFAGNVVDALATLHARFWRHEPPDWLAVEPDRAAAALARYTREGARHLGRYAEGIPPVPSGLLELGAELHEAVASASLRLRDAPQTLTHGDIRLDNLLPGPRGQQDFVAIDWQAVAWNAGAADVAYFLGQSLEPHARREHERALLERYLHGLAAAGIDDYDPEALWRDYRLGLIVSLFSPVGWAAELHTAEPLRDLDGGVGEAARALLLDGAPLLRTLAARNFAAVEETGALQLIRG